jgi:hypothetical protein
MHFRRCISGARAPVDQGSSHSTPVDLPSLAAQLGGIDREATPLTISILQEMTQTSGTRPRAWLQWDNYEHHDAILCLMDGMWSISRIQMSLAAVIEKLQPVRRRHKVIRLFDRIVKSSHDFILGSRPYQSRAVINSVCNDSPANACNHLCETFRPAS